LSVAVFVSRLDKREKQMTEELTAAKTQACE